MDTARRPVGLTTPRPIYKIAQEVYSLWQPVEYSARPFLDAMRLMERIHDNVDDTPGRAVVLGFLEHARNWRGPQAQRIKAELRSKL